ncbi:CaiB/BaiF CoA transferase family protein [Roseomonas populi]|uniref:CoA transferase n=1 Tax=Roseomonas populi TaxID=3121582 RepID=A0ABT1WY71_9PROT|nr:CoA transferase [Roseomonas pecuniae]MCR0980790.1 CoA transferase [Roseomonas pecuniae]
MSNTPLRGIRVLDLTTVVVGPACTQRLADYGAEVIKVEMRGGDLLRSLGGRSPTGQHGGCYLHLNRKKRTVCLDLKAEAGRDALLAIAAGCDVLVTNMRPEALRRLGLDAARLRARLPRLVYCTITGFGPGGPYEGKPAYDSVVQGAAGIGGLFERRDGAPSYVPLLLCDHLVGEIAAGAVMSALFERERAGEGSAIEVPMHETMAAFVLAEHLGAQSFSPPIGAPGDVRLLDPNNRPMRTADGWISLTANTDAQVRAFFTVLGRPDLADDPRFVSVASRVRHVRHWYAERGRLVEERRTAELLELFAAADVPAMPCHSLESLLEDPHLNAVGLFRDVEHPTEGRVRSLRPTVLHDGAPAEAGRAASPVGYDTRAVLLEAGLPGEEIDRLMACGTAHQHEGGVAPG